MDLAATVESYRYRAFAWRSSLGLPQKLALALAGAGVIGVAAQFKFNLPWTPVPVTGQTLAVLLTAVLLGRNWGGIGAAFYAVLGAAGLPWFAGATGGLAVLAGPTGGYIAGFVLAAFFLGHVCDRFVRARSWYGLLGLMLFANFVLIHGPGLAWLGVVTGVADLKRLLWMGCIPFVPGDAVKAVAAAALAFALTPKRGTW
ncbi:MAG: biotin transporter BioY [Bacillota bacterium]